MQKDKSTIPLDYRNWRLYGLYRAWVAQGRPER